MGPSLSLLTCAWLAVQVPDTCTQPLPAVTQTPPHQELWTCSSPLRWHNGMNCHVVDEVSLPFLDCLSRLCSRFHGHQAAPDMAQALAQGGFTPELHATAASVPTEVISEEPSRTNSSANAVYRSSVVNQR